MMQLVAVSLGCTEKRLEKVISPAPLNSKKFQLLAETRSACTNSWVCAYPVCKGRSQQYTQNSMSWWCLLCMLLLHWSYPYGGWDAWEYWNFGRWESCTVNSWLWRWELQCPFPSFRLGKSRIMQNKMNSATRIKFMQNKLQNVADLDTVFWVASIPAWPKTEN